MNQDEVKQVLFELFRLRKELEKQKRIIRKLVKLIPQLVPFLEKKKIYKGGVGG